MIITKEVISDTLSKLIRYPNVNVLSTQGFQVLADWSEQQKWWHEFVKLHNMDQNWRSSPQGDPYLFALMLFRFMMNSETGCVVNK